MLESHKHKQPVHDFDGITENRVKSPPKYFNLLFYGLVIWGVLFCAYYLFSGWSSEAEFAEKMAGYKDQYQSTAAPAPAEQQTAAVQTEAADEVDAAALFSNNCAGCHGADGTGGFGSDLTRDSYTYGRSASDVRTSIAEGRGGKMPGFGAQLSAAAIDALVEYLLEL